MNIAANVEPRIQKITIDNYSIKAQLDDGRLISVPLAWSWRLSEATKKQRENYIIFGNGIGVHWPDLDEDISAAGMLTGSPARLPKSRIKKTA